MNRRLDAKNISGVAEQTVSKTPSKLVKKPVKKALETIRQKAETTVTPKIATRQNKSPKLKNIDRSIKKTPITSAKKSVVAQKKSATKPLTKKLVTTKVEVKNKTIVPKTLKTKVSAVKNLKSRTKVSAVKDLKPTKTTPTKLKSKIVATKQKKALKKPEPQIIAPPKKTRKKPVKPIGNAVFRGKKELYDFKVFSISEIFEPIEAVFVISKRKTDKKKRGHHALICIGQTNSVIDEIKKHRKSRCLKKNEANVISILREENEATRLKIATDLKAAHSTLCSLESA